ncbi:MAG: hypothetical protein E7515_03280 [Ruminococcaceae bacterium]|jgi:Icc-related predicted phosphoesterase|nr:hypothetical protein [Oscillospiraceae bacterium]
MLSFNNGKFKIMQIADVQDTDKTSPDTLQLIEKALDKEKPDLVVFSGDQVKGYGLFLKFGKTDEKIKRAIENILSPVVERNIPFTFCFGNHDDNPAFTKKEQLEFYRSFKNCLAFDGNESIKGVANHYITVSGSDEKEKLLLYILDTNGSLSLGGYDSLDENQLNWYRKVRDSFEKKNGACLKSIVFQHIPPVEVFSLLKRVKKNEKGSVESYRNFKGFYKLDYNMVDKNGFMKESPAVPDRDIHELSAFKEKGEVLGVYFGHDHNNSFHGKVDGIDLGYAQGCGFNIYGPGLDRGMRAFVFDENDIENYETYTVTCRDLTDFKMKTPVKDFAYTVSPPSVYDVRKAAVKTLKYAALGTAVFVVSKEIIKRAKK